MDNYNGKCVVMDKHMSILGKNVLQMKHVDIAVITDNMVAISHDTTISLHAVNKGNTIKIRSLQTKFRYFSLQFIHDDTLVASTLDCDSPKKLVTLTGEERDFDLPFPSVSYALQKRWCTFIPSLETLVISDSDANECYLWNVKDKVKIVVNDYQIKAPRLVCSTNSGIIYVCSEGTKSIV